MWLPFRKGGVQRQAAKWGRTCFAGKLSPPNYTDTTIKEKRSVDVKNECWRGQKKRKARDQAIEEGGELATRYDVRNTRLQGWQKLSRAVEPCTRKEKRRGKSRANKQCWIETRREQCQNQIGDREGNDNQILGTLSSESSRRRAAQGGGEEGGMVRAGKDGKRKAERMGRERKKKGRRARGAEGVGGSRRGKGIE